MLCRRRQRRRPLPFARDRTQTGMTRVAYLTLFFVNAVVGAALREYASYTILQYSPIFYHMYSDCQIYPDSSACFGNQIVYRMSFSLTCFFILTGLLSVALARGYENCCCLLFFQIPFYVAMAIASIFIPNSFFDGYADIARVASGAFIVLQIIIIVDWAYNIRDFFLAKMEDEERDNEARQALLESNYEKLHDSTESNATKWQAAYLSVAFVLSVATIAGLVYIIKDFCGCDLNIIFVAITIFSAIVVVVFSVLSWVNAGLLPSAAVACYLVFMCYQAVHSNPDDSCTYVGTSSKKSVEKSALLNAALAAFTITWTSWRTSATKTNLLTLAPSASTSSLRVVKPEDTNEDDPILVKADADNEAAVDSDNVPEYQFHLLMVLSSFYMAMVITNWGSSSGIDTADDQLLTMWTKIVSQWVATLLFLWTLIAPSVLTDREFGVV